MITDLMWMAATYLLIGVAEAVLVVVMHSYYRRRYPQDAPLLAGRTLPTLFGVTVLSWPWVVITLMRDTRAGKRWRLMRGRCEMREPPDGACFWHGYYWRYNAPQHVWEARHSSDENTPVLKRRGWGSRSSDRLWGLWKQSRHL